MMKNNQKYKLSDFNYCVMKNGSYLIYNTLYNSLQRLTCEEYQQYLGEIPVDQKTEDAFVENGIWIERQVDERKRYEAFAKACTANRLRPAAVTITTTLKCNARCVYCYEKGIRQRDMEPDLVDSLVQYLSRVGKEAGLLINWFGGEPLMNVGLIDLVTEALKKENIRFSSYLITNASRITEEILEHKLKFWNVENIQITLDGSEKQYEIRKNYYDRDEGNYYRILSLIRETAKKDIFIHIRMNIDRENQEDILEMLREIDPIFLEYSNVVYYPAFITGNRSKLSEEEKVAIIKRMFSCVKDPQKLTIGTKLYAYPRVHACMNGDPKSIAIDVDGNFYTCEHQVGKAEFAIGNLRNGASNTDVRNGAVLSQECRTCVFLPKCFGGCESNRKEGDSPCMIEKYLIMAYLELL